MVPRSFFAPAFADAPAVLWRSLAAAAAAFVCASLCVLTAEAAAAYPAPAPVFALVDASLNDEIAKLRDEVAAVRRNSAASKSTADISSLATAIMLIGTAASVIYARFLETRGKSVIGQLATALAQLESLRAEKDAALADFNTKVRMLVANHAADDKRKDERYAQEIAYRDKRDADREAEYEHSKRVREHATGLLEGEIERLVETQRADRQAQEDLRGIVAFHVQNAAAPPRSADDEKRGAAG